MPYKSKQLLMAGLCTAVTLTIRINMNSPFFVEITRQIAVNPVASAPPQPAPSAAAQNSKAGEEDGASATAPPKPDSTTNDSAGPAFSLTGKPFLRALFRSLEVGPGTDYDTFFALSLLISIKQNGG